MFASINHPARTSRWFKKLTYCYLLPLLLLGTPSSLTSKTWELVVHHITVDVFGPSKIQHANFLILWRKVGGGFRDTTQWLRRHTFRENSGSCYSQAPWSDLQSSDAGPHLHLRRMSEETSCVLSFPKIIYILYCLFLFTYWVYRVTSAFFLVLLAYFHLCNSNCENNFSHVR